MRLRAARARSDELFAMLREPAFAWRPVAERHRLVFYLGHLDTFDANLICRDALGLPRPDPALDELFARGIDPVDGALPSDEPSDWPALAAVRRHVARSRAAVDDALATAPLDGSVPWLASGWCAALAVEHRLMHVETLSYLLGRVPAELKVPGTAPDDVDGQAPPSRWVDVPAGTATLGMPRAAHGPFGWDNEHGEQRVEVAAFRIASHDVTNEEHLRFIEAGGYSERSLWTDADWTWREREGLEHPMQWILSNGHWLWRGMHGDVPLPLSWPAWVSHAEASAHARWAGKVLPSEAQYHRAAFGSPGGTERAHPWGDAPPAREHGVFGFERFEPAPAGSRGRGDSAWGVSDLVGNGWKWTRTPFAPLPGFEALPFYAGYSADFFDGRHFVLKGAGPRTATDFLRRSFRNWYQPHLGHLHAAIRLVDESFIPSGHARA